MENKYWIRTDENGQKFLEMYSYKIAYELSWWDYNFTSYCNEDGINIYSFKLLGNSEEPLRILKIILSNRN